MRRMTIMAAGSGLVALLLAAPVVAPVAPALAQGAKPGQGQAAPAPGGDPVLATVNGDAIRMSEVQEEVRNLPEQYRSLPVERIMSALLNQLINNRLLLAEGKKQNLGGDPEVTKRVERYRDRAIQQVLLENVVNKSVNDDALQAMYKKYIAENPPKEEVSARHILVDKEADATAIIQQLRGGADFADLAKKRSKDPAAQTGGDLGYFGREDMVKEFADAAFAMKTGEISAKPVQTKFGWHVIKIEDRRQANPVTFDEAKEELQTQLSQQAVTQYMETLRSTAKIERFGPDGKPLAPAEPAKKPN